jgi:hypothetical protein
MANKKIKVVGAVLIGVGLLALIAGRISYTTHKEVITVGPYQAPLETRRIVPLRPLGALTILGGVILIIGGRKAYIQRRK